MTTTTQDETTMYHEALRLAGMDHDRDIRDCQVVRENGATGRPVKWLIMRMDGRRYQLTPDGRWES